ncbi:Hypothetical_protein [Hexamita inflata]|uniref:Hypothetical_protein n=1 Tax=Hexamita inflata TaxID=28002 RepID=A0AA86QP07_9EUKA|nr:Hypothetical protein HINF_LOCUS44274 [Hexamita inflata]
MFNANFILCFQQTQNFKLLLQHRKLTYYQYSFHHFSDLTFPFLFATRQLSLYLYSKFNKYFNNIYFYTSNDNYKLFIIFLEIPFIPLQTSYSENKYSDKSESFLERQRQVSKNYRDRKRQAKNQLFSGLDEQTQLNNKLRHEYQDVKTRVDFQFSSALQASKNCVQILRQLNSSLSLNNIQQQNQNNINNIQKQIQQDIVRPDIQFDLKQEPEFDVSTEESVFQSNQFLFVFIFFILITVPALFTPKQLQNALIKFSAKFLKKESEKIIEEKWSGMKCDDFCGWEIKG